MMADEKNIQVLRIRTPGGKAKVDAAERTRAKKDKTEPQEIDRQGADRPLGHRAASPVARGFTTFANAIAHMTGRPVTFVLCCVIIVAWAASGPIFHYSDTWQLIINTGTTIITFLMVFLIQNTQNRDGAAVQAKLDELIRAIEGARNHFIGIEHLTEEQLEAIRSVCEKDAAEGEVVVATATTKRSSRNNAKDSQQN
jgi:low affinity Fe/Cu permease